jgi:hypothetical protein
LDSFADQVPEFSGMRTAFCFSMSMNTTVAAPSAWI